jgi:hypothetical protein
MTFDRVAAEAVNRCIQGLKIASQANTSPSSLAICSLTSVARREKRGVSSSSFSAVVAVSTEYWVRARWIPAPSRCTLAALSG